MPIEPTPEAVATLIAAIVGLFTPIAVEALKRDTWKPELTLFVGLLISIGVYSGLHALMGTLVLPVTYHFLAGLFSVFGTQQVGYQTLFKKRGDGEQQIIVPEPDSEAIAASVFKHMEAAALQHPINLDITVDSRPDAPDAPDPGPQSLRG